MADHAYTPNRAPGAHQAATFSTVKTVMPAPKLALREAAPAPELGRPTPRQLSPVEMAHIKMIARLSLARPNRIVGCFADRIDFEDRAEHLTHVLAAVAEYASTVVADTADLAPAGAIDRTYINGAIHDLAAEVIGGIARAAHETEA